MLASDAFFPFPDGVEAAIDAGVVAVVQPGGSVRDDEVVAAATRKAFRSLLRSPALPPLIPGLRTTPGVASRGGVTENAPAARRPVDFGAPGSLLRQDDGRAVRRLDHAGRAERSIQS